MYSSDHCVVLLHNPHRLLQLVSTQHLHDQPQRLQHLNLYAPHWLSRHRPILQLLHLSHLPVSGVLLLVRKLPHLRLRHKSSNLVVAPPPVAKAVPDSTHILDVEGHAFNGFPRSLHSCAFIRLCYPLYFKNSSSTISIR